MAKNFPNSDTILSKLKERGIDVAAKMESSSAEDGKEENQQQATPTSQEDGEKGYVKFSMDEDEVGGGQDTTSDEEVEAQGTPEEKKETSDGQEEEPGDITLDSGTDNMPLEQRKKLLIKDYHKKTAAVAEQRRELENSFQQVRAAAEKVQQMYDYVENVMQQQQQFSQQQRQQPDTEEAKKQRIAKIISNLGLEVDQYTDENVIKLAMALDESNQSVGQLKNELTGYIGNANASAKIGELKRDYATLSEKYKLDGSDEEGVLAMMNNMLQYNRNVTMEDAVQKYLGVTKINDAQATIERLKRGGHWEDVKKLAFAEMRKKNDSMPTVPSGAGAIGGSVSSQVKQNSQTKFASIREAAAAAVRDLSAGRIRNTTRRR
jgi:hypothetical protein